jgi:uncharacterized protein (DUF58 family)
VPASPPSPKAPSSLKAQSSPAARRAARPGGEGGRPRPTALGAALFLALSALLFAGIFCAQIAAVVAGAALLPLLPLSLGLLAMNKAGARRALRSAQAPRAALIPGEDGAAELRVSPLPRSGRASPVARRLATELESASGASFPARIALPRADRAEFEVDSILRFKTPGRGLYRPRNPRIEFRDSLGLANASLSLPELFAGTDAELVVPPAPRLPPWRLGDSSGGDESLGPRSARRGEELSSQRPYQAGDDARRVNWRATSRLGQLIIRQADLLPPPERSFVLILDRYLPPHYRCQGPFEAVCEAAMGILRELDSEGARYSLRMQGLEPTEGSLASCARALAEACPYKGEGPIQGLEALIDPKGARHILVCLPGSPLPPAFRAAAGRLPVAQRRSLLVFPAPPEAWRLRPRSFKWLNKLFFPQDSGGVLGPWPDSYQEELERAVEGKDISVEGFDVRLC